MVGGPYIVGVACQTRFTCGNSTLACSSPERPWQRRRRLGLLCIPSRKSLRRPPVATPAWQQAPAGAPSALHQFTVAVPPRSPPSAFQRRTHSARTTAPPQRHVEAGQPEASAASQAQGQAREVQVRAASGRWQLRCRWAQILQPAVPEMQEQSVALQLRPKPKAPAVLRGSSSSSSSKAHTRPKGEH